MARMALGTVRAAGLSGVLFLLGGMVPFAGGFVMLLAPLPILTYAVGLPAALPAAVLVVLLAGAMVTFGAGPLAGLCYTITLGLAAVTICYMLGRKKPFELVVVVATGVVLVAGCFAAFVAAGSAGALAKALHDIVAAGIDRGQGFYRTLGVDFGLSADARARVLDVTVRLAPALAALAAGVTVLLNLALFWRWGGRERLGYNLFGELVRWSTPEWLIWLFLATGFGLFIPLRPLGTIALDGFVCVAAVYFCQGLAITAFYFKMLAMPAFARVLIYFVMAVQPVLAALVCAAGVFDLWIDFRRLKPPSREAGSFGDFL